MSPLRIRPAVAEDAASVLALWVASRSEPTRTDTLPAVERLVREHPGALLVAESEGRLAGTIIAGWDGWRGTLYRLAVVPEMRRRGIARELVGAALRQLSDRGAERVSAFVVESDELAVGFWDALTDFGVIPDPKPKRRYVANLPARTNEEEHDARE